MALSLVLDSSQTRVKTGRVCAFHQGASPAQDGGLASNWSDVYSQNSWICPLNYMAMREPAPLGKTFKKNDSGVNARFGYSDFGLTAGSGGWLNPNSVFFDTEKRFYRTEAMSDPVATIGSVLAADEGLYFETFVFSGFASGEAAAWFGYGSNLSAGIGFEVSISGQVGVHKDGQLYATGSVKGELEGQGQDSSQRSLGILTVPFAQNQLLVYSPTMGGGFIVSFPELVGTSDPITPAGKAWFQTNGSADVTFAKVQYASGTAYHCSKTLSFADKPGSGFSATIDSGDVFQDGGVTATVVKPDNSGAYVPTTNTADALKCRIRYDLPAQGFAYAAIAEVGPDFGATAEGAGTDLRDHATGVSLEVPDSPAGVALHLEGLDPDGIDPTLKGQSNRPFLAKVGGVPLLDGRTEPPHVEWAAYADAYHWEIEVRDAWKALEHYYFRDPLPLDNLSIADALQAILSRCLQVETDVSSDSFTVPLTGACSKGEWSSLIEVGDSASEQIQRLMETYAGNWWYGFRPSGGGIKFFAKSPDDLGTEPKATLYGTRAGASTAGLNPAAGVYRKLRTDFLEPEATEVRVTGYDPVDGRAFQAFKVDADAEEPTTAVADRPPNWVGEKRPYGLFDPGITTQDAANRSCDLLFHRLTPRRDLAEWESAFLLDADGAPLWRGDAVALDGVGTYRIVSFRVTWDVDEADGFRFQSATYCGEKVG